MKTINQEIFDTLGINSENRFPMMTAALNKQQDFSFKANLAASNAESFGGSMNVNVSEPLLEVIFVGPKKDAKNAEIVCWLEVPSGGVANHYSAELIDKDGNPVDAVKFISFDKLNARAVLSCPIDTLREYSVKLASAAISNSINSVQTEISLADYEVRNDIKPEFNVIAPAKKPGVSGDTITVCCINSLGKYDYVYPKSKSENKLMLEGNITISVPEHNIDSVSAYLWLATAKNTADYNNDYNITPSPSEFNCIIDADWKCKLLDCFNTNPSWTNDVIYYLSFECRIDGAELTDTFIVTNDPNVEDSPYKCDLKKIDFYVDCVSGDSLISMKDGSTKKIKDVVMGDKLICTGGGDAVVEGVYLSRGVETAVKFTLANGKTIISTSGHTFMTERGIAPAFRLKTGIKLLTDEGYSEIISAENICGEEYEMVTLLTDNKPFYVNGIASGDMISEQATERIDWVREDLPSEWLNDYDNAVKAGIVRNG